MSLRLITGLVIIIICIGIPAIFPMCNLYAQGNPLNDGERMKSRVSTGDIVQNYDINFLSKDTITPSKTGYIDDLVLPAEMSPLAERNLLNGIASAGSRVVTVGILGHILYSDNRGKSWIQARVPVSTDLTAVYFPSPKKGWAVGHDGVVLHSEDGGATWTKQLDGYGACRIMNKYYKDHSLPGTLNTIAADKMRGDIELMIKQGPVTPFLDVWFENELTGFVVGAFNQIFYTEDGGKSWVPWFDRTDNPTGMHLYAIRPIDNDIYISGEQGLLMKLDRKAKYFKSLKTPYVGTYFGVIGQSGTIVAFGMRGNIFRSTDGGANWQKIETLEKAALLGGMVEKDGSFILVSQAGNILISKDCGKHFIAIKREAGIGIPAHAVTSIDNSTLIIASWLGVQVQKIEEAHSK